MKKKIIIYDDDDEEILLLCKAILSKSGLAVETLSRCEDILSDVKYNRARSYFDGFMDSLLPP
ncbi:MAG: hypothetical protein ABIP79_05485 [Chitinophagaceae bacterium]